MRFIFYVAAKTAFKQSYFPKNCIDHLNSDASKAPLFEQRDRQKQKLKHLLAVTYIPAAAASCSSSWQQYIF